MSNVNRNVCERWEQGIPHHPKTMELIEALDEIDKENGWPVDIKTGGDGDWGEDLMYLMDIHFETLDENQVRE